MKNLIKTIPQWLLALFFASLILNYFYGSSFYSAIVGTEKEYTIGQLCSTNRVSCENIYFKENLDDINSISNESRSFFSNIYIKNDRIGYTGNCPCPYNSDSRGGSCGERSSYSKGGQISYCYDRDVSDNQIAEKRTSMIADAQKKLDDAVQKDLNIYNEPYTLIAIFLFYGGLYLYTKNKGIKRNINDNK